MLFNLNVNNISSCIYFIACLINNLIYIGQTNNYTRRISQHSYDLKNNTHTNSPLQESYNKYGDRSFICGILQLAPNDERIRLDLESYYKHAFQTVYPIANKSPSVAIDLTYEPPFLESPFSTFMNKIFYNTFAPAGQTVTSSLVIPVSTLTYQFDLAMINYYTNNSEASTRHTFIQSFLLDKTIQLPKLSTLGTLYLLFPNFFILEFLVHYPYPIYIKTKVSETYIQTSSRQLSKYLFNNKFNINTTFCKNFKTLTHSLQNIKLSFFPMPTLPSNYAKLESDYNHVILTKLDLSQSQLHDLQEEVFQNFEILDLSSRNILATKRNDLQAIIRSLKSKITYTSSGSFYYKFLSSNPSFRDTFVLSKNATVIDYYDYRNIVNLYLHNTGRFF